MADFANRFILVLWLGLVNYAWSDLSETVGIREPIPGTSIPLQMAVLAPIQRPTTNDDGPFQQRDFTQVLKVGLPKPFDDNDVQSYQLLMSSYTDQFIFDDATLSPPVLSTCEVTGQDLVSLLQSDGDQQNMLTISFTMRYDIEYNDSSTVSFPALLRESINSNLESVTIDMQSRFLPVFQAMEIVAIGTTLAPVGQPSKSPTTSPVTEAPTDEPTTSPVTMAPTNEPTTSPVTMAPTEEPTRKPTNEPTESPSKSPSSTPSISPVKLPTMAPITPSPVSAAPSTPWPTDPIIINVVTPLPTSQIPTSQMPTVSTMRTYTVPSVMVLHNIATDVELDRNGRDAWIDVTQDWIRDEIANIIMEDSGERVERLDVTVMFDGQEVLLENRRMLQSEQHVVSSSKFEYLRRRKLQQQPYSSTQLQISFRTYIELFSSEEEDDWDPKEIVASGFKTLNQQEKYLEQLRGNSDSPFEGVDGMTLEVDGEVITDEAPQFAAADNMTNAGNEKDMGRNTLIYIIIGSVGAAFLLLLTCCCAVHWRNKKNKRIRKQEIASINQEDESSGASADFEETEEEEEEEAGVFHSITALAPPGKLGLVISNPHKNVPIVLQMKRGSVMQDTVRVGDLLLSVDEVDCRGMSAADVSELVRSRSEEDVRTLVLLREQ